MWEQFRAVRQAIRRPMRRWWLRVGSWWIGVLVLLLGVRAWGLWDAIQGNLTTQVRVYGVISSLDELTTPIALVLWFLAAVSVRKLVSGLVAETAAFSQCDLRVVVYWNMICQGMIPIMAIALRAVLSGVFSITVMERFYSASNATVLASHLSIVLLTLPLMLFVLALLACLRTQSWIAGLWLVPQVFSGLVYFLNAALWFPAWINLRPDRNLDIQDVTASLVIFFGLCLYYGIAYWVCRNSYRKAIVLSIAIVIVLLLDKGIGESWGALEYSVQAAGCVGASLGFLGAFYSGWADSPLRIGLLGNSFEFNATPISILLAWLINGAVLAFHFFAFTWMLRNIKPRAEVS